MKDFDLSPEGVLTRAAPIKSNGKRCKVKMNHPAAAEKLFTIEWLGEATEDFLNGDITRAYTDKFGTTYGESLRGSWMPVGEEGENWSWVRYNPKKGCRMGAKRNPVGKKKGRIKTGKIAVSAATRAIAMKMQARRASMTMKKNPVGRGDWFVLFQDAKGVISYYAGDSDRGVRLTLRDDEAYHLELRRATQLVKKLNTLYAKTHKDGADFYVVAASTIKANPVYRSTEPDINEIRMRNAASGVPYERSLSLRSVDEDEDQPEDYNALSERGLRELLRYRDPNGYATLGDEGPVNRDTLIEALTYLDDLELGK